ncbi:hypothetical protein [Nocardia sp. CA-120079]|uniref:hypothetical protein n=1 Tax=Nocardia sp. CA-120079 TaxID=3239974 RepID=UPI003D998812
MSAAAEQQHVMEPAISMTLTELERALETQLCATPRAASSSPRVVSSRRTSCRSAGRHRGPTESAGDPVSGTVARTA